MNVKGSDYLVVLGYTRILIFLKIARAQVALNTLYKYANK